MRTALLALWTGLLVGVSCSCGDRTVTSDANDPEVEAEERRLCETNCERKERCSKEHGVFDPEHQAMCLENCLDHWFGEERALCRETAIYGLTCESQAICPQDSDAPQGQLSVCNREKHPWAGCKSDPEAWVEVGCTVEKCLSGECCPDVPDQ